jgi:hypothetical protein
MNPYKKVYVRTDVVSLVSGRQDNLILAWIQENGPSTAEELYHGLQYEIMVKSSIANAICRCVKAGLLEKKIVPNRPSHTGLASYLSKPKQLTKSIGTIDFHVDQATQK